MWDRLIACSLWSRQFLLQFLGIGFIIKPAELQLAHNSGEHYKLFISCPETGTRRMEGWRQGIICHYLQASVNKNFIEFSHCCSRITGNVGLAEWVYLNTTFTWAPRLGLLYGFWAKPQVLSEATELGCQFLLCLLSRPTKLRACQTSLLHSLEPTISLALCGIRG